MKWNLILPAIDAIGIPNGNGAPTGTPPFNGARYRDNLTGVIWLGRNVLNFNNDTSITLPSTITSSRVYCKIWHNDPAPVAMRPFLTNTAYTSRVIRSQTTGFVNATNTPNLMQINGSTVANNSTDFTANQWSTFNLGFSSVILPTDIIGRRSGAQGFIGRIVDIGFEASGSLTDFFAIDEGSGTTIIDSAGGQNGTLTIGSGSWELTWVPQN